jgi:hypothetical protein
MESLDELVKRLTGKGDVGASLLGFVLAYLLELKFALVSGLTPGTAGSLGAAAAVGLKNTVEALWNRSRPTTDRGRALEKAAKGVRRIDLGAPQFSSVRELKALVLSDHESWSAGLITDDEFEHSIKLFAGPYRNILVRTVFEELSAKAGKS